MNKKTHKLGLIVFVLTLLVGCSNVQPDSTELENTNATEKEDAVEKANFLEKDYELNYRLDEMGTTQDYGVYQPNNKDSYQDIITKTVDIHTFAQNFNGYGSRRGINDVMEVIGLECLRETEGAIYSVHKVKQGGLLYIFYRKEPWRTEIKDNGILRWYYVRERLSLADFDYLEKNVTTIQDSIAQTEIEQIYLNCYRADSKYDKPDGSLSVGFYLEDGILVTLYELVDGELVLSEYYFQEGYDHSIVTGAVSYPYDAQILEMDWVE